MPPEDTAVAEIATGLPMTTQDEEPTSPETVVTGIEAETGISEPTETGERQLPDLGGLSDEEIAELPAVKSLLARYGESQRQRALAEAAGRRQEEISRYHDSETFVGELSQTFKRALDEGELKPEVLRAQLNALVTTRDEFAVNKIMGIIDDLIPDDLPVSKTTLNRRYQAINLYRAGRLGLPDLVHAIVLNLAEAVAEVKFRPQLEKIWKQEWQAGQETARLRKNEQARGQQKGPTPIVGASPGQKGSYADRLARGDKIAPEEIDALTTNLMNRRH